MEVNLKEINYVLEEHRDDTERKYLTFWSDKQLFGIRFSMWYRLWECRI